MKKILFVLFVSISFSTSAQLVCEFRTNILKISGEKSQNLNASIHVYNDKLQLIYLDKESKKSGTTKTEEFLFDVQSNEGNFKVITRDNRFEISVSCRDSEGTLIIRDLKEKGKTRAYFNGKILN